MKNRMVKFFGCIGILVCLAVIWKIIETNKLNRIKIAIRNAPNEVRHNTIQKYSQILSAKLKTGSSKDYIREIMGDPDNLDNEHVWLWALDVEEFNEANPEKKWRKYPHGIYILFDDGKSVFSGYRFTGAYPLAGPLWEASAKEFGYLIDE